MPDRGLGTQLERAPQGPGANLTALDSFPGACASAGGARQALRAKEPDEGALLDFLDIEEAKGREFRAWFGASEVLDASGNPLRVFRGLPVEANPDLPASPTGFTWFTTDRLDAVDYSPACVVEAYLAAENIADLDSRKVKSVLRKAGLDAENLFDLSDQGETTRRVLLEAGYGGAYVARPDIDEGVGHYAVFSPDQIKVIRSLAVPQIETHQFKTWFRDSKVVDEQGEPLVVYHGSPVKGFTVFDLAKVNPDDPDASYNGFWFSSSEDDAGMSGDHPWGRPDTPGGGETRPFFLSLQNPATRKEAYAVSRSIDQDEGPYAGLSLQEATRLELQKRGYDGVIHEAPVIFTPDMRARVAAGEEVSLGRGSYWVQKDEFGGVDLFNSGGHVTGYADLQELEDYFRVGCYVAFLPTQIKSATGNVGTFDSENPDTLA